MWSVYARFVPLDKPFVDVDAVDDHRRATATDAVSADGQH